MFKAFNREEAWQQDWIKKKREQDSSQFFLAWKSCQRSET